MNSKLTLSAVCGVSLGACLLNGCGLLYTNIRIPYAYNSATPADVQAAKDDPSVTGRACDQSIAYLVAWGNAGFDAAVQKALEPYPGAILYDVKTDVKVASYLLGLYTRSCTIVSGRAAKP